jgi:hypothetical protein
MALENGSKHALGIKAKDTNQTTNFLTKRKHLWMLFG